MIRVLYTDGITDGDLVRVTDWPNKDRLEGWMFRKLIRHAVQEVKETCQTGICSFEVLRVEGPEAPFYDRVELLGKDDMLMHGDSIMFGMVNDRGYIKSLSYGRSRRYRPLPGLQYGLKCERDIPTR